MVCLLNILFDNFPNNSPVLKIFVSEFDLEKEKSLLDEQGLRIAENQENSQKNRRKLAESTRGTFRFTFLFNNLISNPRDLDSFS